MLFGCGGAVVVFLLLHFLLRFFAGITVRADGFGVFKVHGLAFGGEAELVAGVGEIMVLKSKNNQSALEKKDKEILTL